MAKHACVYLAMTTLATELITIVYSTIAVNKLLEVSNTVPARSAIELLARDYEMGWLGANVHFFAGLITMITMASVRVWLNYGPRVGRGAAFAAASSCSLMIAIVNNGIAQGDG